MTPARPVKSGSLSSRCSRLRLRGGSLWSGDGLLAALCLGETDREGSWSLGQAAGGRLGACHRTDDPLHVTDCDRELQAGRQAEEHFKCK